jgi:hypothetical protein
LLETFETKGTSGRLETMFKTSNLDNLAENLLASAIKISIKTAKKAVKSYSPKTIIGLAKTVLEAWTALGRNNLELFDDESDGCRTREIFSEVAKVWPQVTYALSKFMSGQLQMVSRQSYLPRLSLIYGRPVFEITFDLTEQIMFNKAAKAAGSQETLNGILSSFYEKINPQFAKLTESVNLKVRDIMHSKKSQIDAYCSTANKSYLQKCSNELPGICSKCKKLFRNQNEFSCCTINFLHCRTDGYKELKERYLSIDSCYFH